MYYPITDCEGILNWLLRNHYDVFGLIDQGLAVDINEIKQ